jgi:hypothetical protein
MRVLRGTSFNDGPVRKAVTEFFQKKFNILLNETPTNLRLIDLTGVTETKLGVEVEGGGFVGNFWENDSYSLISGLGFRTLNIPIRKEKHWQKKPIRYRKERHNPSYNKNIFVRTNKDFTQIMVIRAKTIRNPKKVFRTKFKPNNSDEVEEWLSFRREDVETYNLVDGKWILDKTNGNK